MVYPDARRQRFVAEHYTVTAVLDCIIEGSSPAAITAEAIEGGLLTRLDHAADLDREPALADRSFRLGDRYIPDCTADSQRAPSSGACRCEADEERACDSASGG